MIEFRGSWLVSKADVVVTSGCGLARPWPWEVCTSPPGARRDGWWPCLLPAWLRLQPDLELKWKYPSKGISGSWSSWLVGGKGYYLMTDSGSQCLPITHRINICWEFQGGVFQKTCISVLDFWSRETMGPGGAEGWGDCGGEPSSLVMAWSVLVQVRLPFLKNLEDSSENHTLEYEAYLNSTHFTNIYGELASLVGRHCGKDTGGGPSP